MLPSALNGETPRRSGRGLLSSAPGAFLVVFSVALLYFFANHATSPSGDNLGTRALAASLAARGSFALDDAIGPGPHHYSVTTDEGGRRFVAFPSGTGILAGPIYLVARGLLRWSGTELYTSAGLEKAASAILSAVAVAVLFLALAPYLSRKASIGATALFAMGTPTLTTTSQGLWSFTGETLVLTLMVKVMLGTGREMVRASLSGALLGLAVFCRPTAIVFVVPPLLHFSRRPRVVFSAVLGLGLCLIASAHLSVYGGVLGAYGALNAGKHVGSLAAFMAGLSGVLLSPSRGLVWFLPILPLAALSGLGPRRQVPEGEDRRKLAIGALAIVLLVVLITATYDKWWGGHSVGPRLLTELSLPCALLFGMLLDSKRGIGMRRLAWGLAALQMLVFSVLHFSPRAGRWSVEVALDANPSVLWSVRDSQVLAAIRPGWTYVEPFAGYDLEELRTAAAGYSWSRVDLSAAANARYDLPGPAVPDSGEQRGLHLPELTLHPLPEEAHLRPLLAGRPNAVRVCRGETSGWIDAGGLELRKLDTLLLWRGPVTEEERRRPAGYLELEFASGKRTREGIRFGSEVLLRDQLDLSFARAAGRFYGGSISAPGTLQRQRFTFPGSRRLLSAFALEIPGDGPDGCLYLLAASAGRAE